MPKGKSGIKRSSAASPFIDKNKYEKPVEYVSTSGYSYEMVKDPKGRYTHAETYERYSIEEHYAENPGFRAIRSAPVGSVIVVHNPTVEARLSETIPAHDEYYEVKQRTKSMRELVVRGSMDAEGRYIATHTASILRRTAADWKRDSARGWDVHDIDLTTVKDIQARFIHTDRITIYRPKGES